MDPRIFVPIPKLGVRIIRLAAKDMRVDLAVVPMKVAFAVPMENIAALMALIVMSNMVAAYRKPEMMIRASYFSSSIGLILESFKSILMMR